MSSFNAIELIENCLKIFVKDLKQKSIELNLNFERSVMMINSDQYKFNQILFALLSNACKHTFTGFIQISVNYCENGEAIQLIVKDTGMGISNENLPNIFTLFSRTAVRSEINPQGIGLPCFICKKYVELLKGSISVSSELNKGTTFIIQLPVGQVSPEERLNESLENLDSARPLHSESRYSLLHSFNEESDQISSSLVMRRKRNACNCNHFLIVDDDPTNIKVLQSYFHSLGIKAD